jgi:hypothetical protein
VIAAVLYLIIGSRYVLIISLGTVCFILILMWSPPPKHKTFSDDDRIQAMSRGGSGPPRLWTPGIPGAKERISQREFKSMVHKANMGILRFFLIPIVVVVVLSLFAILILRR